MRRTKEDAAKTKKKIVRCAVGLFIKNGYENTSLNMIASKAGVTKGAIYWHFEDKDALLSEIMEFYDSHAKELIPRVLEADVSPLLRIKCLTYAHLPDFETEKETANFMRLKNELSDLHRRQGKQPYAVFFVDKIAELLRQAKTEGEIDKSVNEDITSLSLTLLITSTYVKYNIDKNFFKNVTKVIEITDEFFKQFSTAKGEETTKNYREQCLELFPEILGF